MARRSDLAARLALWTGVGEVMRHEPPITDSLTLASSFMNQLCNSAPLSHGSHGSSY